MRNFTLPLLFISATICGGSQSELSAQSHGSGLADAVTQSAPVPAKLSVVTPAGSAMLQSYFERYCDYSGGLPNGSYDLKFRQQLKLTDDNDLKRLFVLKHLYIGLEVAKRDYHIGQVRVGKVEYRAMTDSERVAAKQKLLKMLNDLESLDPTDPLLAIESTRNGLKQGLIGPADAR